MMFCISLHFSIQHTIYVFLILVSYIKIYLTYYCCYYYYDDYY